MDIKQALQYLDPNDDAQWTTEGLPRLEAVAALVGKPVRRQEVTDASPQFNRAMAGNEGLKEDGVGEGPAAASTQHVDAGSVDAGEAQQANSVAPAAVSPASPPQQPPPPSIPEGESVLERPAREILGSRELTERALQELGEKIRVASEKKKLVDEEVRKLNEQNAILTMHMDRMTKADHGRTGRDISAYLETQKKVREDRAKRAQAFIAQGTTAKDVADQLRVTSKLDAVMTRKTGLGNVRPAVRPLSGAPAV